MKFNKIEGILFLSVCSVSQILRSRFFAGETARRYFPIWFPTITPILREEKTSLPRVSKTRYGRPMPRYWKLRRDPIECSAEKQVSGASQFASSPSQLTSRGCRKLQKIQVRRGDGPTPRVHLHDWIFMVRRVEPPSTSQKSSLYLVRARRQSRLTLSERSTDGIADRCENPFENHSRCRAHFGRRDASGNFACFRVLTVATP